jgi:hypothetical protein
MSELLDNSQNKNVTENQDTPVKKKRGNPNGWPKGVSGNPGGRPKLPEEIKEIKEQTLQKAIIILHDIIEDPDFMKKLKPQDQARMIEIAYDRFGLPKVTETKLEVTDNSSIAERMKKAQERLDQSNK